MKKKSIQTLLTNIFVTLPDESYEIYADPMFEKVLYNLIDNSIRHGEKVTQIALSYEKSNSDLILRYTDNGTGISGEDKKKIFTKGFGKNTGLGLFLIREILSLTGISITEHGVHGTGVIFDMLIPAGFYRISALNKDQSHL
jgi:signal transduction histidine kinase